MSTTKVKPPLLLYFAVPPKVNLEDRRYDYRKHLRMQGFEDKDAVICQQERNDTVYLYVEALQPFLKVLKFLPYRLKEAKRFAKEIVFTFQNYDFYDVKSVSVQDRDSVPARLLEALLYFAFEGYGVSEFTAKRNGDVEITLEEFFTDYTSDYRTNPSGYMMISSFLNGLGENKFWLESSFSTFENNRKKK